MITTVFTMYSDENGNDRFQAHASDSADPDNLTDVTDQYDVVAMGVDDGRTGIAFIKKAEVTSG